MAPPSPESSTVFTQATAGERQSTVEAFPCLNSLNGGTCPYPSTHIPIGDSQSRAHICSQGKLGNVVPSWAATSQLEQYLMARKYWFWWTASYLCHTCKGYKPHINIVLLAQLCPTLCDPKDCSPPGSSVHEILQARILEWVAIPFPRGSSQLSDHTQVSCFAGRFFTIWATREAPIKHTYPLNYWPINKPQ